MATEKKNTALAVVEGFQIANRYQDIDPELLAELQDEMEDLDPDAGIACRQIKIPSGGGIAYEVQGEDDGDADSMKEIRGVIIFTHRLNAYWPGAYGDDDQNRAPVCSSMDGKTGLWSETGEVRSCEACPLNQYGSAVDQKGGQARGKACKNMRRVYLMMDGDPNFYLLTVPPTSIKEVNRQITKIVQSGTPYGSLVCSFKLEKDKNAAGIAYSKVVISRAGTLPKEAAAAAVVMRRQIKEQYQSIAITQADYTTVDTSSARRGDGIDVDASDWNDGGTLDGAGAFEEAPPHTDGDAPLPFA